MNPINNFDDYKTSNLKNLSDNLKNKNKEYKHTET